MQQTESKRFEYSNKVNSISSDISSLSRKLSVIDRQIHRLDKRIQNLPTRIAYVRQQKYRFLIHIEKTQTSLNDEWVSIKSSLLSITRRRKSAITSQIQILQRDLPQKTKATNYNIQKLNSIESRLANIRINVSQLNDHITDSTRNVLNTLQSIERDLTIAENTVNLVTQASYQWKKNETPVLAVKVNDLNNDRKGVITLTNYRIIFEGEREVVLKKRFFIVTEKKTIREVIFEKPIGIIHRLTKGRVGLLKGSGIFIEFKPQSGLSEMKLDTKGYEADWMVRFYNFVISGQADEELVSSGEMIDQFQEESQLVICQMCGAPYDEEIYKGQTSVKCKYCGVVISLG